MKNVLIYKRYEGSVEFSSEDKVLFGKILNIRDVVTFEGVSVDELTKSFQDAVNDYLKTRARLRLRKNPEKNSILRNVHPGEVL